MIVWPALALAVTGLLGLQHGGAHLEGAIVEGRDQARIEPPTEAAIDNYHNNGYKLTVEGDQVVVEVSLQALESTALFVSPAGRSRRREPVRHLARSLTRGSRTRYEAVSRVLSWVARNIRYELDRDDDQSPTAVLERGAAYCTGTARLTVALLRSVGIVAREVPGLVLDDRSSNDRAAGARSYHRWIEVHYPDRGWVFSDPLVSHHFVPASYVRLATDRLERSPTEVPRLLQRRDEMRIADVYRHGPAQIVARSNQRQRDAAAVRVQLATAIGGEAVLVGEGLRRQRALARGEVAFVGLDPGLYRLQVRLSSGVTLERSLRLQHRGLVDVVTDEDPTLQTAVGAGGAAATERPAAERELRLSTTATRRP